MINPFDFFGEVIAQAAWVVIWVNWLVAINMSSVFFWNKKISKIIFVTFMLSAVSMMGLYSIFGYEKILGAGHILWIPLLIFILSKLGGTDGRFKKYVVILSISIMISLVLDVADVYKYFTTI